MNYVGKTYPIHDAVGKATGKCKYTGDLRVHGMLHMAVVFSPIAHGRVKSIDCTKALELEGVVDVIHCFNTTKKEYNRYLTQYGQDLIKNERLFNEHVRFVGDRVGAVIAETEEIARKAVKLIEVEYEEFPFALTPEEALKGKIDQVFEEGPVFGEFHHEHGDAPTGNNVTVTTKSHLGRINHLCMETHAALANYNPLTGELTIHSPNQTVFGIRTLIAEIFEMDVNKVRVIKETMGGSFGAKQEWVLEPIVAAAALKVGRPVRLVYNRNETIISTFGRSPMDFDTTFTFSDEGKLLSVDCDVLLNAGAYVGNSVNYARTIAFKLTRGYSYPHLKFRSRAVITNSINGGAFRGWTSPEATIMFEHNMNMGAKKLKMDPLDLRLLNVMKEDDVDPMINVSLGNYKAKQALEKGRKEFDWDAKKKENQLFNANSKRYRRGIGVALGAHVNSFYPGKTDFARVSMGLTESGTVYTNVTLHDHGCGTVTAMKTIAAEALGINPQYIHMGEGDTGFTPFDVGCFSSRTTYVVGRTVGDCAKLLREEILKNTAEYTGEKLENLYTEGQGVYSKANKDFKYTWQEVFEFSMQHLKKEVYINHTYTPETNPGVAGAHFAQVEVDTYTGMVKILDYLAVHDIGQAINREICIAQTQGAVIMGSGAALTEHVITRSNGVASGSIKDYHVINSFEAPDVRVSFIEDRGTEGPYGAKSIGEVCHTPVTATIVGAVNDALNSEINTIPLTPDAILAHLNGENYESNF